MANEQLDLFDEAVRPAPTPLPLPTAPHTVDAAALDDDGLLDGLADLPMEQCLERVREIGRRKLSAACVPLEGLCLRHAGFGRTRIVPEQAAAIEAMIAIGGGEAGAAVGRLIGREIIGGPGLSLAFFAADLLRFPLQEDVVRKHLRHDDPAIRCAAARCVRAGPQLAPILIELLDDLHGDVQVAAACALGRLGAMEARPLLKRCLQEDPTLEVIDASAGIADHEIIVFFRRLAASRPELSAAVMDALESADDPTADKVLAELRALQERR
ncbi:MAG: HEAT repeat domain-containing protein [Alphaproteobacteria bacterium]|nr:HEAT repeat domain-containing protein [Alphaproteobacteria bacterium]